MSNYQLVKLSQLAKIRTGRLDANDSSEDGKYPFFTCSKEPLKISSYSYDCECVLVAGNGDLNVKYYNGKFDAYQRTYIIESLDKQKLFVPYLYEFLNKYVEKLRELSIGGVIKYIKLENISNAIIPIPTIKEQKIIADTLGRVSKLTSLRKIQIEKLDLLIKSQFIEMFGGNKYPTVKTEELCEYITKGTTPPIKEIVDECGESNIPYLKVYNLSFDGTMLFNEKPQYISRKIHNSNLSRSKVYPNDVLMNIVGPPLGKFALVTDIYSEWNINQAIAIFRSTSKVNPRYLLCALMQPDILRPFIDSAVGIRQQNLSLQQCRNLEITLPPMELQTQFSTFVQQVDKQKIELQNSLIELNTLHNALLQKYFD